VTVSRNGSTGSTSCFQERFGSVLGGLATPRPATFDSAASIRLNLRSRRNRVKPDVILMLKAKARTVTRPRLEFKSQFLRRRAFLLLPGYAGVGFAADRNRTNLIQFQQPGYLGTNGFDGGRFKSSRTTIQPVIFNRSQALHIGHACIVARQPADARQWHFIFAAANLCRERH